MRPPQGKGCGAVVETALDTGSIEVRPTLRDMASRTGPIHSSEVGVRMAKSTVGVGEGCVSNHPRVIGLLFRNVAGGAFEEGMFSVQREPGLSMVESGGVVPGVPPVAVSASPVIELAVVGVHIQVT